MTCAAVACEGLKFCKKCETWKERGEFNTCKKSRDGLQSYCVGCNRREMALFRTRNEERNRNREIPPYYTKQCANCGDTKTADKFYRSITEKDGLHYYCRDCARVRWASQSASGDKSVYNRNSRLAKHGLTPESYAVLESTQGGACGICEALGVAGIQSKTLKISTNRLTGKIRGLLCNRCDGGMTLWNNPVHRAAEKGFPPHLLPAARAWFDRGSE